MYWRRIDPEMTLAELPGFHFLLLRGKRGALLEVRPGSHAGAAWEVRLIPLEHVADERDHRSFQLGPSRTIGEIARGWRRRAVIVSTAPFDFVPAAYPPSATPPPKSRLDRALDRIDDVREEYGQLKLDIVYHIDNPALFDGDCPTTAQFLAALWEADHLREGAATSTVEALASKIEVAYAVAREHAERVGLQHLPKDKRAEGRRASKAARLVTAGATEGERAAARTQLRSILESLALYYLPSVEEVRALEAPSEDAPVDTGR